MLYDDSNKLIFYRKKRQRFLICLTDIQKFTRSSDKLMMKLFRFFCNHRWCHAEPVEVFKTDIFCCFQNFPVNLSDLCV